MRLEDGGGTFWQSSMAVWAQWNATWWLWFSGCSSSALRGEEGWTGEEQKGSSLNSWPPRLTACTLCSGTTSKSKDGSSKEASFFSYLSQRCLTEQIHVYFNHYINIYICIYVFKDLSNSSRYTYVTISGAIFLCFNSIFFCFMHATIVTHQKIT